MGIGQSIVIMIKYIFVETNNCDDDDDDGEKRSSSTEWIYLCNQLNDKLYSELYVTSWKLLKKKTHLKGKYNLEGLQLACCSMASTILTYVHWTLVATTKTKLCVSQLLFVFFFTLPSLVCRAYPNLLEWKNPKHAFGGFFSLGRFGLYSEAPIWESHVFDLKQW